MSARHDEAGELRGTGRRFGGPGGGLVGPTLDDLDTEPDLGLFDEPPDIGDPLDDGLEDPFDDDGIPDAALFLPFRDGRPGWR